MTTRIIERPCPYCLGARKVVRDGRIVNCPMCGGRGYVEIEIDDERETR